MNGCSLELFATSAFSNTIDRVLEAPNLSLNVVTCFAAAKSAENNLQAEELMFEVGATLPLAGLKKLDDLIGDYVLETGRSVKAPVRSLGKQMADPRVWRPIGAFVLQKQTYGSEQWRLGPCRIGSIIRSQASEKSLKSAFTGKGKLLGYGECRDLSGRSGLCFLSSFQKND